MPFSTSRRCRSSLQPARSCALAHSRCPRRCPTTTDRRCSTAPRHAGLCQLGGVARRRAHAARTFLTWKRGGLAGAGAESTSMADMIALLARGREACEGREGWGDGGDEERKGDALRCLCALRACCS